MTVYTPVIAIDIDRSIGSSSVLPLLGCVVGDRDFFRFFSPVGVFLVCRPDRRAVLGVSGRKRAIHSLLCLYVVVA